MYILNYYGFKINIEIKNPNTMRTLKTLKTLKTRKTLKTMKSLKYMKRTTKSIGSIKSSKKILIEHSNQKMFKNKKNS